MSVANVLTFPMRPDRGCITPEVRAGLELAAQTALDTADRIIALLDRLDGDAEHEEGGDDEPSLGAPEDHASQVVWLRGADDDREVDRIPEARGGGLPHRSDL